MDDTRSNLFIYLVIFWTLLTIFSHVLDVQLMTGSVEDLAPDSNTDVESSKSFVSSLFNTLDDIPVVNVIVPLLKIMSFQYTTQIPYWVSLILNMFAVFTGLIAYSLIRNP